MQKLFVSIMGVTAMTIAALTVSISMYLLAKLGVCALSASRIIVPSVNFDTARSKLSDWSQSSKSGGIQSDVILDTVSVSDDGRKAADYLTKHFWTKKRAKIVCKEGLVSISGLKIFGTRSLKTGECLTITIPAAEFPYNISDEKVVSKLAKFTGNLLDKKKYNPPAHVLYEDDDIAVLFKPAGIHTLRWEGTIRKNIFAFDDVLPLLLSPPSGSPTRTIGDALLRPLPCHRLDAKVSGCVVCGKTKTALSILNRQFESRHVTKEYCAVIAGDPRAIHSIAGLVAKADNGDIEIAFSIEGRPARTLLRVEEIVACNIHGSLSRVALFPLSGRRHQLRKHCALIGCPIIGDDLYHECAYFSTVEARLDAVTRIDALGGKTSVSSIQMALSETASIFGISDRIGGVNPGPDEDSETVGNDEEYDDMDADDDDAAEQAEFSQASFSSASISTSSSCDEARGISSDAFADGSSYVSDQKAPVCDLLPHPPVRRQGGLFLTAAAVSFVHPRSCSQGPEAAVAGVQEAGEIFTHTHTSASTASPAIISSGGSGDKPMGRPHVVHIRCAPIPKFQKLLDQASKFWSWSGDVAGHTNRSPPMPEAKI